MTEEEQSTIGWLAGIAELAGRQECYSPGEYGVIVGLLAVAEQLQAIEARLESLQESFDALAGHLYLKV